MTQHSEHSSYREKLIEHLFVGELLKVSWLQHKCVLEIAKPEVDNAGCDIIAEAKDVVRHIQLKTSMIGGKTGRQNIHAKLADKPSGCVVWIYFNTLTMELGPFYYFGGKAGEKLPSLEQLKIAKHTKGNKDGLKADRKNIRVLPKAMFKQLADIEHVYETLFQRA